MWYRVRLARIFSDSEVLAWGKRPSFCGLIGTSTRLVNLCQNGDGLIVHLLVCVHHVFFNKEHFEVSRPFCKVH